MLYFFKESETGKALIFSTEKIGATKELKLPNGKIVNVKVQVDNVKFAMVAKGDEDWGEMQFGEKVSLNCTDSKVIKKDGTPCENLYWATV